MLTKPIRSNVLTLTLSSLLGLTTAIGAVATARATELPAIHVSYGDLDLSRPADVETLYGRLRLAATGACMPLPLQSLHLWTGSVATTRC